MKSIFSELPHALIIDIIRIENDRKKEELITKRKYNEVIKQLTKLSNIDIFFPSVKDMFDAPPGPRGGPILGCWVAEAADQELLFDANPNCW